MRDRPPLWRAIKCLRARMERSGPRAPRNPKYAALLAGADKLSDRDLADPIESDHGSASTALLSKRRDALRKCAEGFSAAMNPDAPWSDDKG